MPLRRAEARRARRGSMVVFALEEVWELELEFGGLSFNDALRHCSNNHFWRPGYKNESGTSKNIYMLFTYSCIHGWKRNECAFPPSDEFLWCWNSTAYKKAMLLPELTQQTIPSQHHFVAICSCQQARAFWKHRTLIVEAFYSYWQSRALSNVSSYMC